MRLPALTDTECRLLGGYERVSSGEVGPRASQWWFPEIEAVPWPLTGPDRRAVHVH